MLTTDKVNAYNSVKMNNKRPMGHIAHVRNQFKSINTFAQSYDYEREKKLIISFLIFERYLYAKPCVPFTQGVWLKLAK